MRQALGLGDCTTIDKWRQKFGRQWERSEKTGRNRGVWLYAPDWLRAYFAATLGHPTVAEPERKAEPDHSDRLTKAKADKAELELERLRGQLLHVDDAKADLEFVAAKLREGLEMVGRISPDAQAVMVEKLREAEAEWDARHGNHADTNGKARVR